ncbi:hypothetical protein GQ55_6G257300 [Panicum hallii var. hallii]|uniref:Uncharacterized protein n=1 Tax=Panicum hallii var. hallii TaxID=1504633 RepID=A0A2T7D9L6_9POAL|nr:hypothetical protein GQ55_6G257300 [Panicum hallii var. hallii]
MATHAARSFLKGSGASSRGILQIHHCLQNSVLGPLSSKVILIQLVSMPSNNLELRMHRWEELQ